MKKDLSKIETPEDNLIEKTNINAESVSRRNALRRMAMLCIGGLTGQVFLNSCEPDDNYSSYSSYSSYKSYSSYSSYKSYSSYNSYSSYSNYSNYYSRYAAYNNYSNYYGNYYIASW